MLFPERFESDRLAFERLARDRIDLFELYRICSSDPGIEDVTRYTSWSPHRSIKETTEFVDSMEEEWDDEETATYVLRPLEGEDGAGEIAGVTALHCDWERRTGVFGMWLRKQYWGRGYSGERAAALMKIAFERLDLEVVAVTHHVDNENSQRAIEKYIEAHNGQCDGCLRNRIPLDDEVADELRYTVTKAEYREATQ